MPVLLAAALGLVAAYLDPRTLWWSQLFAVVLPYLALGLVGALVVALAIKRRKLALVLAVPLVFALVRAEPWARLGEAPPGETLNLVTFNVPQRLSDDAMRDSMAAFLSRETPDLVALQDSWIRGPRRNRQRDAWQAPQLRGVAEVGYSVEVPLLLPGVGGWKRDATGVPLLVREGIRVEEQEAITISDPRDNRASQAIRSVVVWEDRRFVLYDVHLRSFGDAKPWQDPGFALFRPSTWGTSLDRLASVYRNRAIDVDRITSAIERETLPVVVAGDFNSTADNWSYRELRQAGGVRRLDAFREAGRTAWGRTYHANTLIVRIDHVLVDPALAVVSADVRNVGFSDHRPVLTELRWREEDANSPREVP
ncbi:MAG: endonuclease/exonuclease/phosphatase family protein [Bacteroidota bacterium]